jgi:hypothetical protein
MGVDGGAGNAISLSEVQTFYGGSNPISMSEYYRGGSEVPNTRTDTTTNTGVTGLVAQGFSSGSTGGSGFTGNQTSLTIDGANNTNVSASPGTGTITFSASTTVSVTKDGGSIPLVGHFDSYNGVYYENTSAHLRLGGYDFLDAANTIVLTTQPSPPPFGIYVTLRTLSASEASGTVGISVIFVHNSSDKEGNFSNAMRIRRGGSVLHSLSLSYDNGVGSASNYNISNLAAGDIVEVYKSASGVTRGTFHPRESIGGNVSNTFAAGTHAVSFHGLGGNNNTSGLDATLNFSTSGTVQYNSFGGGFTSISTSNTGTSVNTNTNVPTSGTINMNVFNAPGTASA